MFEQFATDAGQLFLLYIYCLQHFDGIFNFVLWHLVNIYLSLCVCVCVCVCMCVCVIDLITSPLFVCVKPS